MGVRIYFGVDLWNEKNIFAEMYEGIRGNFTIQTGEYYLRDQLLQV